MAKRILIADDEPDVVKMLGMRLKSYGYDVIAVYDGVMAVKLAHEEKPDLIILDIKMPGLDGYTVFENLKKSTHTNLTPIMFISALPPWQVEEKAAEIGADDFIPKPYDPEKVLEKVKKLIGE